MNKTETITVTSNQSKRTFTIRKYEYGKLYSKYKTSAMTPEEFEEEEMNTEKDWDNFLNNSGNYYKI